MVAASRLAGSGLIQLCLDASVDIFTALTSPGPVGGRRKKKALLIGINYSDNQNWKLKGPQTDVESVKELLIEHFKFSDNDIVVLSDKEGVAKDFIPTKHNIMRRLENEFVNKDQTYTDYFFVYSGHSWQREEKVPEGKQPTEEDGQEEFIIPSDGMKSNAEFSVDDENTISDTELNKCLVKRLGKGSQLVAIFDSCHSGTLLNLKHHRCNRTGDLLSLIQDTARRVLIEPLYPLLSTQSAPIWRQKSTVRRSISRQNTPASPTVRKSATLLSTASRDSTGWTGYSVPWRGRMWCTGFCPRLPIFEKPQVVCISACKDSETLIESEHGGTIIPAIVTLLRENQAPTYREVMSAAKLGVAATHKEIAGSLSSRMKDKKCHCHFNHLWKWHGCTTRQEHDLMDMAHQTCDPQLSSRKPLNTKTKLRI